MSKKRYYIPQNFAMEGVVFGFIKIRNMLETIAVCFLIGMPVIKSPLSVRAKVYMSLLFLIPLGILSIVGINGLSLTSFLYDLIITFRDRKVYTAATNKDRIQREKLLIQKKHKKIRQIRKLEKEQRKNQQAGRIAKKIRKSKRNEEREE